MESLLNLAWAVLAALMFCLWLRFSPHNGLTQQMQDRGVESRQMQFVALIILILILFPVISVTDDLQAIQNPAETDSSLRRNQVGTIMHAVFPTVATLPPPALEEISFGFLRLTTPVSFPDLIVDCPALTSIQNRPPPVA
jgi:hypothetical protein